MLEACLPFGPWVTSKVTRWPSFRVLKPFILIAEKCANRSSPPSSGVMKPKPLASLNHLTVQVAICVTSLNKKQGWEPRYYEAFTVVCFSEHRGGNPVLQNEVKLATRVRFYVSRHTPSSVFPGFTPRLSGAG